MPRGIHRLTTRGVAALTKPGRHADGGNLYLQISPSGSRQWTFLFERNHKQREMGLGSADAGSVTLADAREKALEARRQLAQGFDPIEARNGKLANAKVAGIKFGKFADDFVKSHAGQWSNLKHAAQWSMTLGDAYCSSIRGKAVAAIHTDDILGVLEPVWQKVPETARRVRMRLEKVLDAARVRGYRNGENPARWKGHLDHLLPKHGKATRKHHAAMAWENVPNFLRELEAREGTAALAFKFLILTAARTSEVLNAQWSEIDLASASWTIPAERMKARREHRVPLSQAAMEVLHQATGQHRQFVFPGPADDGPLSNMALLMLLRRLKHEGATAHGMRSAFRDWASECTNFSNEVAEMALAHMIENRTESAYRRGDLFQKRKALMEEWGKFTEIGKECFPSYPQGKKSRIVSTI
jgi:integrase